MLPAGVCAFPFDFVSIFECSTCPSKTGPFWCATSIDFARTRPFDWCDCSGFVVFFLLTNRVSLAWKGSRANLPNISWLLGMGANSSPGSSGVVLTTFGEVIDSLPEVNIRAKYSCLIEEEEVCWFGGSSSSLSTPLSTVKGQRNGSG